MLVLRIDGIEGIREGFKRLGAAGPKAAARLAHAVFEEVQDGADAHTKTGALFQSVRLRKAPGGYLIDHDERRAPHAEFVQWGTKPHVIQPKNRKMLRWAHGKSFVFARFVRHPGYKGDPYMKRAAEDAPRHFERIIRQLQREV
ncbi:hypothetical protein [Methylococcus mesophilus]|uniref:hypothetical protein n=1 Tax=Methylococcus mesophilus TaxID=2993564 RepID=UPI00224B025A|nr:hypothetical protein [Methylococcus mesophilus]UZR29076.1 hypothetical protein OOT43_00185 [Methylococcus mesophilus]